VTFSVVCLFFEEKKNMNAKILCVLLFVALVAIVKADIPVHCEASQVVGKWTFDLTAQGL